MQVCALARPGETRQRTTWLALYTAACVLAFFKPLYELLRLSFSSDAYSHILIVPAVSGALLYAERAAIFQPVCRASRNRACLYFLLFAAALCGFAAWGGRSSFTQASLTLSILSFLILVWSGFAWMFGWQTFRAALFPLGFLLLLIPPPPAVLDRVVTWLQWGSADVTGWIFRLAMTPAVRQGLIFDLPGVSIEIAPDCSGIRSSIALAITCLAAGYLFLRMDWTRAVFWLAIVPVAILKNGIRIATLSLLAIHVDPGFLYGSLHHDGGFVFFGVGLMVLWCLLRGLQRAERWCS
jgi:exosortase